MRYAREVLFWVGDVSLVPLAIEALGRCGAAWQEDAYERDRSGRSPPVLLSSLQALCFLRLLYLSTKWLTRKLISLRRKWNELLDFFLGHDLTLDHRQ